MATARTQQRRARARTAEQIRLSALDLASWAAQMDRAAESAQWLAEHTKPGVVQDRARARMVEAQRLAQLFRDEQAAWERLWLEQPWRVDLGA